MDDFLANAERDEAVRQPRSTEAEPTGERPWLGSVTSEITYWKRRAQRAEHALAELLRARREGA